MKHQPRQDAPPATANSRHTYKWIISTAAVAAAGLLLAACSSSSSGTSAGSNSGASSGDAISVTVAQAPTPNAVYMIVAEKQGFFTKNHLNVKVVNVTNLSLLPAAVASGQYNFAVTVSPLFLSARSHNLPVVATAGGAMEGNAAHDVDVIVPDSSSITSLAGLGGKKVGTAAVQGNQSLCLQWAMRQKGANPKSMSLAAVPFTDQQAQLASKQIDAALMEPPQSTALIGKGYRSLGDPCLSIGLPQAGAFLMSNNSWASSNATAIKDMQNAIAEAGQWMSANKSAMPALLSAWAGTPADAAKAYVVPQVVGTPPTKSDLDRWSKALVTLGVLTTAPDLSAAIVQ
jgi:ABC-type nitrate/sulfonate/bicarbonate transport system substrate-binding protein